MKITTDKGLFVIHNQGCSSVNFTLDMKFIPTISSQENLIASHIFLFMHNTSIRKIYVRFRPAGRAFETMSILSALYDVQFYTNTLMYEAQ